MQKRTATVKRETKETSIRVELSRDTVIYQGVVGHRGEAKPAVGRSEDGVSASSANCYPHAVGVGGRAGNVNHVDNAD